MALEEWKDLVGSTATFFTILQFLIGSQVLHTRCRRDFHYILCPAGLLLFLQKEDHRGDLLHDLHSGGGDDLRLVELREARPGLRPADRQWNGSGPPDRLLLLLLQLHQRQDPDREEDVSDLATPDPGPDVHRE